MKRTKSIICTKRAIFYTFFILAHIFILNNFFLLSKDIVFGDSAAVKIFPSLRYGFNRIPPGPSSQKYQAQNRLAVDFAQIYFPSQEFSSLSKNYQTGYLDPFQRPSRYAPFVHFVCSITICKLDYGYASLLHMLTQMLLFYFFFIIAFCILGAEKDILLGLLLVNICLFLTPAGLSWFERGQFSLYVGLSYLLLILGFIKNNFWLVILSALFAFIKWTSFPYIFIVFSVFILTSKSMGKGKQYIFWGTGFLLIVLFLSSLFPDQSISFLQGLYNQERFAVPGGISLAKILPLNIAKILPIPLIILGYLNVKTNQNVLNRTIPFLIGSAVLSLTYPTLAYEYSIPCLLCFVPLIFYWTKLPNNVINHHMRAVIKYSFFAFVFFASYSNYINQRFLVFGEYFLISTLLLFFPILYPWILAWGSNRSVK